MASKTRELQRQQQLKQKKQELFDKACDKTRFWHVASAATCVVTLLFLFVNFAEVYNTDYGVEVKVSGWSFFIAGLTKNFLLPIAYMVIWQCRFTIMQNLGAKT